MNRTIGHNVPYRLKFINGLNNHVTTYLVFLFLCGFTLFAIGFTSPALAQTQQTQPLVLSGQTTSYNLEDTLRIFSNVSENTHAHEILSRYRAMQGASVQSGRVILPASENSHWLVFSVFNQDRFNQEWLLSFGSLFRHTIGYVNDVEIYDMSRPDAPFIIDGRKVFNKTQKENQLKNLAPLDIPVGQLKIFAIKINVTPGFSASINMQLLSHSGLEETQKIHRGHDFTVLLVVLFLLVLIAVIAHVNKKPIAYLLLPYILFLSILIFTRDEIISYGNNTLVLWLPAIGMLGYALLPLLSSMISIPGKHRKAKISLSLLACGLFLFASYSIYNTSGQAVSDAVTLIWLPFIPLIIHFGLALYFITEIASKKSALLLSLSAISLIAAHAFSAFGMITVESSVFIYAALLLTHAILYVLYTYMELGFQAKKERKALDDAQKKQQQEQKIKEQQKTADQERLVNILQRERELLAELKEREAERAEAMRHARNVADEANRAKSAFLAVISHEIRTPMTGIMGMVRLLLDSDLKATQKEYAETIQYSGDALLALLNDILDFSKIEEGRMEIEDVNFDLRKMIDSVVMLMSGRAKERRITLKTDINENVPRVVIGDPTRLRQVLLNLIGNAIKFTEQGGVTLQIMAEPTDGGKYNIYIGVQDTGIGIPKDAQKTLFNPFSQADSTISRRFGGTGLGLAICKRLVTAMGGEIKIDSAPNEGSLFYFTIPMAEGQISDTNEDKVTPIRENLYILVADDNVINQKVLIGLLSKDQHKIEAVSNGQEAVEAIQKNNYDMVLMDMEMPVMDGLTATKAIRDLSDRQKSRTPIIAMTANVIKEDIERCRAAGMNEYVSKPIDPDKLRSVIATVAHEEGAFKPKRRENDKIRSDINPDEINHLNLKNEQQEPSEAEKNKTTTASTSEKNTANEPLFDENMLGTLKDSLGIDVLDDMMQDLYEKSEELIAALEKALDEKNYTELRARGHDLKGMTSNFGLTSLSKLAGVIEKESRAENNIEETIRPSVEKLKPTYDQLKITLDDWFKS